jgi:hypothetical protein
MNKGWLISSSQFTWLHLGHLETYEVEGGYSNCIHGTFQDNWCHGSWKPMPIKRTSMGPCTCLWWRLQVIVWGKMESLIIFQYQCQVTQVVKDNLVLILKKASVQTNLDAQFFAPVTFNILRKVELYFLPKNGLCKVSFGMKAIT